MRRSRTIVSSRIVGVALGAVIAGACAIDLDEDVAGKPCKDHRCLSGYTCDSPTNTCVVDTGGNGGTGGQDASTLLDAAHLEDAGGTTAADARDAQETEADAVVQPPRDAAEAEAQSDSGSGPNNGVTCRDLLCSGDDVCCVTDFPGYPNLPPSTAFSCVSQGADAAACEYILRCDEDGDCPTGDVCCSTQGASGWVARCASSCSAPAVHLGCTKPEHCADGFTCCGIWSGTLTRITNAACRTDCGSSFNDRTFCDTNADCPTQQCLESASVPGFHICSTF